jgi:amidase
MHFSDEITRLGCPADVTGPDGLVHPLLCARRRKPMDRRLETAGEIEMAMPMKRVLCLVVASCALIGALYLPARGAGLNIETATMADLNAAFAEGTLTSEQLVSAYLKRIEAYNKQGPAINAVITLNKKALDEARQLDAERKSGKVRGPLHGIPIVLKDNYDTVDMPTTAGSQLLEGHMAKQDAFMVKKLREAGAIMLAKVNLHEFSGNGGSVSGATDPAIIKAGSVPNGFSSAGGQTKNPHELLHGPAGSSSGTGAAVAAAFAQFGLGTDTGGSIRNPSSANGIVGLKPTHGLLSRAGIVPLALSFDTGGPMARSVYDVAAAPGVMTGVDPADDATKKSEGRFERDFTKYLKMGALKGARIGIARDFMGKDAGTDEVVETAIVTLKKLGAVVIDPIKYPDYILQSKQALYNIVTYAEFKAQIADYLKTSEPQYPKTLDEIVARANDPKTGYRSPEKAVALKYTASVALDLSDPSYIAAKNEALVSTKAAVMALFAKYQLDAIVYPTLPRPAQYIKPDGLPAPSDSPTNLANETGFPDLIVPAGMTWSGLPVTISFFGQAFSEGQVLAYGYDFEQATKARVLPKHTPGLLSDVLGMAAARITP